MQHDSTPTARTSEQGIALVVVLWVLALTALQVVTFNAGMRDAALMARTESEAMRAGVLARAGIELAVAHLGAREQAERWKADGQSRKVQFGGANLTVRIDDENARVDLNKAPLPLLTGLFRTISATDAEALSLANRVLDWRDSDDERRDKGAELPDYRRSKSVVGPANAPFTGLADLTHVLGMPKGAADRLAPLVTLFSRNGRINARAASADVLRVLPGLSRQDLDTALAERQRGTMEAFDARLAPVAGLVSNDVGPAYRVMVDVAGQGATSRAIEAVLLVGIDGAAPYRILAWRDVPRRDVESR